jgi:outer membrane receptor protein involved in Fe transport
LNSTELMAKVTHHLPGNQQLSLTGYFGKDTYDNAIIDDGAGQLSNSLRWGNAAANVRWIGVVSPSLFFSASAIYTRYGFDVNHHLEGIGGGLPAGQAGAPETFVSDYLIEDAAVRAHAEYFYDEYHTMLAGVELVRHRLGGRISEFSSQIAPMSFGGSPPWELSVYLQDQWRLTPPVLAELGARATSFIAKQGSFSVIDPRFSLLVTLRDDLRLYSSFSAVNQFVHPYRHSGIFLFYPSIFFYPSTENIQPSTSLQVSLGMEKNFHEDRYRVVLESYYRTTQKLHEFLYDTIPPLGATTTLADALLLGEGNVYGAEITIDKRLGAITGSVRYGFSWANNRFAELNGGESFRPRFDRRHEVFAKLSYSPHENWTVGAVCLLSSNQFPSFTPRGLEAEKAFPTEYTGIESDTRNQYAEPYDLNGGRLPGFQRLELRVQHRFSGWGVRCEATLRLLNGYGLVDPFVWALRRSSDSRLRWTATFDPPPLFPLYPVVSMGVRF